MRYARILGSVVGVPWAILPDKGRAMLSFLAFAASGGVRDAGEIESLIGRRSRHEAFDDGETTEQRRRRMEAAEQKATADRGGIAVVSLSGIISPRVSDEMDVSGPGGTSAEGFTRRLGAALDDPRVGGVVVDVDSPGGNVYGVPEAFSSMLARRGSKPIVAVCNPLCASAAYWIASAADAIAVTPSGEIGSVGVYAYHEDLSAALAKAGVAPTLVKADLSPDKGDTHPAFPLTDAAKADMQASVDRYAAQFVADIAKGRGLSAARVAETFAKGRVVGAEEAVRIGMADRVATLDAEIARMAEHLVGKPARAGKKNGADALRRRLAVA